MSLLSRMTEIVDVYARSPETDEWLSLAVGVACSITEGPLGGGRREQQLLDPEVTHTARTVTPAETFAAGQRLRRPSDGAEWVVRAARRAGGTGAAHTQLALMESEPTIGR